jgi:hypothetical protein
MTVINCKTGMYADIEFKQVSWTGADNHAVVGGVYESKGAAEKGGKPLGQIKGTWSGGLNLVKNGDTKALWEPSPQMDKHDWQYFFTPFTLKMNHLPDELKSVLPRSDSRLRTD